MFSIEERIERIVPIMSEASSSGAEGIFRSAAESASEKTKDRMREWVDEL